MQDMSDNTEAKTPLRYAYVRAVKAADLPPQIVVPEGMTMLYAIHGENGEPLALVGNRDMAFTLARNNRYAPVHVH